MRRILTTSILLFLVVLKTIPCFSQSAVDLPSVVPPPADAASLGRYGDVPVNMGIGLPDINVPVYDIKTPRLSVPITLNYYASGIKVDDQASWVGLGWSLNAGGVITRTIRDKDDVGHNGFVFYNNNMPLADTLTPFDYQYEDNVSNGLIDVEPDYFFYNFSGHSGKFIFGSNGQPLIISYQDPLQITFDIVPSSFTILDGQGNQYLFAGTEQAQSYSTSLLDYPDHGMNYTSAWYLTRIVSFDKSDTISFQYSVDAIMLQTFDNYSEGLGPTYTCSPDDGTTTSAPVANPVTHDGLDVIQSESFLYSNPLRLQEIDFRNGKVAFFNSGPRLDNGETKLDSLIIYNLNPASQTYGILKTVRFSYDYFESDFGNATGYRLRLDSVRTIGNNLENGGVYAFQYDSTMLPLIGSTGRDLFNFYNGANSNPTLVPAQQANWGGAIYSIGAANRSTNTSYIQAGILKHIYYPTGGRTDLSYESNSYSENQYSTNTIDIEAAARGISPGGIQMGVFGQTDTVLYTATNSTQTTMAIYVSPYSNVEQRPFVSCIDLTANQTLYLNGVTDPINGLNITIPFNPVIGHVYQLIAEAYDNNDVYSSVVINETVTTMTIATNLGGGLRIKQMTDYDNTGQFAKSELYKYGSGESGYGYLPSPYFLFNVFSQTMAFYLGCASSGGSCFGTTYSRTIFSAYSIYDVFNLSSNPLSYPEVAKYQIDSLGNFLGKSVFDYSVYSNGVLPVPTNNLGGTTYITNSFSDVLLLAQTDYSYKSGLFAPVKKTINGYNSIPLQQGRGCKIGYAQSISGCYAMGPTGVQYYAFDYPVYTGTVLKTGQTVYDYDQLDSTKVATKYSQFLYDNLNHLQPTTVITNRSDGTTLTTINRYPAEAAADSVSNLTAGEITAIDSLQSQHNITALIQAQTFRNSSPVDLVRYDYKVWPNNMILQDSVEEKISSFVMEPRLQYFNYDNYGNLLQDAKESDVFHSYLWDYHDAYPIAEIVNAAPSDIAYTSFEADGSGNWTIASPTRQSGYITGTQSYNLTNGGCSVSGLTTGNTYVVSYWSRTGSSYLVTGSTAVQQGKTIVINGVSWTYFEHTVTGTSAVSVTGTGGIDELRLYPQNAQMTTYTYQPLVGITSKCDVDNRVTYYNYDGLGRLKYVSDQDGNIVKTFEYHYVVN